MMEDHHYLMFQITNTIGAFRNCVRPHRRKDMTWGLEQDEFCHPARQDDVSFADRLRTLKSFLIGCFWRAIQIETMSI